MSALLVSKVSTRRDYWRNTAVTPTKIQSSWRRIFVDRSYHVGPFLVGWSATRKLFSYHSQVGTQEAISMLGIDPGRIMGNAEVIRRLQPLFAKHRGGCSACFT